MNNLPKAALVGIFIDMAESAQPNTRQSLEAQAFFKDQLMAPLIPPGDTSPERREQAFWQAAADVANKLGGGATYQTPETYDALMSRIEKASSPVYHAVRKSCLNCGAAKAPGWN